MKRKHMKKIKSKTGVSEMLAEYNFDYSKAKPNRFITSEKQIVVRIDDDVAKVFDSAEKVNSVLRAIITTLPNNRKKYSGKNV